MQMQEYTTSIYPPSFHMQVDDNTERGIYYFKHKISHKLIPNSNITIHIELYEQQVVIDKTFIAYEAGAYKKIAGLKNMHLCELYYDGFYGLYGKIFSYPIQTNDFIRCNYYIDENQKIPNGHIIEKETVKININTGNQTAEYDSIYPSRIKTDDIKYNKTSLFYHNNLVTPYQPDNATLTNALNFGYSQKSKASFFAGEKAIIQTDSSMPFYYDRTSVILTNGKYYDTCYFPSYSGYTIGFFRRTPNYYIVESRIIKINRYKNVRISDETSVVKSYENSENNVPKAIKCFYKNGKCYILSCLCASYSDRVCAVNDAVLGNNIKEIPFLQYGGRGTYTPFLDTIDSADNRFIILGLLLCQGVLPYADGSPLSNICTTMELTQHVTGYSTSLDINRTKNVSVQNFIGGDARRCSYAYSKNSLLILFPAPTTNIKTYYINVPFDKEWTDNMLTSFADSNPNFVYCINGEISTSNYIFVGATGYIIRRLGDPYYLTTPYYPKKNPFFNVCCVKNMGAYLYFHTLLGAWGVDERDMFTDIYNKKTHSDGYTYEYEPSPNNNYIDCDGSYITTSNILDNPEEELSYSLCSPLF